MDNMEDNVNKSLQEVITAISNLSKQEKHMMLLEHNKNVSEDPAYAVIADEIGQIIKKAQEQCPYSGPQTPAN